MLPALGVLDAPSIECARPRIHEGADLALIKINEVPVARGKVQMVSERTIEIALRIVVDGNGCADQLVHRLVEQGRQDLVLAGEVPVDRGAAQPGSPADLIDPHAVESLFVERLRSGVEDLPVPVHAPTITRCERSFWPPTDKWSDPYGDAGVSCGIRPSVGEAEGVL